MLLLHQDALRWLERAKPGASPAADAASARAAERLTRGLQLLSARLQLAAPDQDAPAALAPGTLSAPWAAAASEAGSDGEAVVEAAGSRSVATVPCAHHTSDMLHKSMH